MNIEEFANTIDLTEKTTAASQIEPVMCTVPVELLKAVAHIGVDFGYGEYELEQEFIDEARNIYTQLKHTT